LVNIRLRLSCVVFAVALGPLSGGTGPGAAAHARKPATHTVVIEGTRFQPDGLTVRAGDSVVWVNKDPFPHTATSKIGGFDSQAIQADKSWTYVAKKKGEFDYICTFHPTMTAKLRVR
jgi:plastocyanin